MCIRDSCWACVPCSRNPSKVFWVRACSSSISAAPGSGAPGGAERGPAGMAQVELAGRLCRLGVERLRLVVGVDGRLDQAPRLVGGQVGADLDAVERHRAVVHEALERGRALGADPADYAAQRAEGIAVVAKQMDVIERVLADAARERHGTVTADGPFACGAEPCVADAALFPTYVFLERILPRYFGWDDVWARRPRTKAWFDAMASDACGARVLGEIRGGLDDWHDTGRWETTGVVEAVKDETYAWTF